MKNKNLTKSLAMIGLECPRKLYYHNNPQIYQNTKINDPFLLALAEGGFQVGALAKFYYPEGISLANLNLEDAIAGTKELLLQDRVTIFEAAFMYKNLLVRTDLLIKEGDQINLLEVKAKSYDPAKDSFFDIKTKQRLLKPWVPYLQDLAYQMYVCKKTSPNLLWKPFLYLINKNITITVDGLNQKFKLLRNGQTTKVEISPDTNLNTVGEKILIAVNATEAVEAINLMHNVDVTNVNWWDQLSFEKKILDLSAGLLLEKKLPPRLDPQCKHCEFRGKVSSPLQSGFKECWSNKITNQQLDEPLVFDVWYYGAQSNKALNNGKILMEELVEEDFNIIAKSNAGLTRAQRQWLQVKYYKQDSKYFDKDNFAKKLAKWQYPLHFIDFETSKVALPFNKGRRPYEQIAFQFSHHVVDQYGQISHVGQYLNDTPGQFPNFDFVRALKSQLEQDEGTIFRYASHENTVLCDILQQLGSSLESDREELIAWIKTITKKDRAWLGKRNMVDLYELVINYFYHPMMQGSNSLKVVFPTILNDSKNLQEKYKLPIYGALNGIKSLNFNNWALIQHDEYGKIKDPYKLLPKLFTDLDFMSIATLFQGDEINHGGAAMTAYAKMQFTEMSGLERQNIHAGLLKYCELDTLAMVLLYEYFLELL